MTGPINGRYSDDMTKSPLLMILLASVPAISIAQEAVSVTSLVSSATEAKTRAQKRFAADIDPKVFTDRLAIDLILKQQNIKSIEQVRQILSLPEVADKSKMFTLPSLQASLNIYTKGQNAPIPDDLQTLSKNAGKALEQIIAIREDMETTKAHNPHAPSNVAAERELDRRLSALQSQYDNYLRQLEALKRDKYGVESQQYGKVIIPIISSGISTISRQSGPAERDRLIREYLDGLENSWR